MNDSLYTEDGLNDAIETASLEGIEINDDVARAACSTWHGGQFTPFYAFSSSGHFDRDDLLSELSSIISKTYANASTTDKLILDMLGTYFINRKDAA